MAEDNFDNWLMIEWYFQITVQCGQTGPHGPLLEAGGQLQHLGLQLSGHRQPGDVGQQEDLSPVLHHLLHPAHHPGQAGGWGWAFRNSKNKV